MRDAEREARWLKRAQGIGEFLEATGEGRGAKGVEGGRVVRLTIRYPTGDNPEVLLVVKVQGKGGDFVGFVGGLDVGTAVLTWRAKDGGKGLKWREDRPWGER